MSTPINTTTIRNTYIEAQGLLANAYHNLGTIQGKGAKDTFTIGVIKQQLKDAAQKFEESRGEYNG